MNLYDMNDSNDQMIVSIDQIDNLNALKRVERNNQTLKVKINDFIYCDVCKKKAKRASFKGGNFCSKMCFLSKLQSGGSNLNQYHNSIKINKNLAKPKKRPFGLNNQTNLPEESKIIVNNENSLSLVKKRKIEINPYKFVDDYDQMEEHVTIYQPIIRSNQKIELENSVEDDSFNWSSYLEETKSKPVPINFFRNPFPLSPNEFKVGMILEGYDHNPENENLICLLSIVQIQGYRLRLHYEGYDSCYDFWRNADSQLIFPLGYCEKNDLKLSKPNDIDIASLKSAAAPSNLFNRKFHNTIKNRPNLESGMKLEAVDKLNPVLIRVATIVEVKKDMLKIQYDGWSNVYDTWFHKDSEDLHPIDWCKRTGHHLSRPINHNKYLNENNTMSGCQTIGCFGIGHVKGPKFTTHYSESGCPYSLKNLNKEITNRLSNVLTETNDSSLNKKKSSENKLNSLKIKKSKKRGRPMKNNDSKTQVNIEQFKYLEKILKMQNEIKESVYLTKNCPSISFKYDSQLVHDFESSMAKLPKSIDKWRITDVQKFVEIIPGCAHLADSFQYQEIDGEALQLISQADLVKRMNIKLGPALKIYNYILKLKENAK